MDIREKLVELMAEAMKPCDDCANCQECSYFPVQLCADYLVADHMIANGVTVQEWIPVSERLPDIPDGWSEAPIPVLFVRKGTSNIYAGYYGENGTYRDKYFRQYADRYEGVDAANVLCWMWQHDLPAPPKGVSEEALPVADEATERSVAVEKTEDQRKPEGFIRHRKLEVSG